MSTTTPEVAAPERSAAPDRSAAPNARPPFAVLRTIVHLAALGVVGITSIGLLLGLLGLGIGLTFVLGIGLIALVGLIYALTGVAWYETVRVGALYDIPVNPVVFPAPEGPGFKNWLRSVWQQVKQRRTWIALASFFIASLMGAVVLGLFQRIITALITVAQTFSVWWQPRIIDIIVSGAIIVGLALLHRVVTVAIIGGEAERAEYDERTRVTERQREGAVRAADVERTRIERDLHDGVQPRLVSVGMTLGLAKEKIDTDPGEAKALVEEAHTSTKAAITELRQLARGIYASVLDDRGLDAALSALAGRSHVPVVLDVRMSGPCSRDAEAAVYFTIAESLTNAAKHSRASECRVTVRTRDDGTLWARVEDNGIGGAVVQPGGGLDGVNNRVLAAGGSSRLESPKGGPTALEVTVPCGS